MNQFIMLTDEAILKKFNIMIPLLTENIMISPSVINKMTEQEKKQLLTIFRLETLSLYDQRGISVNCWAEQVSYNIW